MSRAVRRTATFVAIAVVTLFAFEGAVTAFTGKSLLRRLPLLSDNFAPVGDLAWRSLTDEERMLAAARNPGILRLHPDPLVGYTLRINSRLAIHDGDILSDGLGLRARPRPWPAINPLHILVVGASVPFGYGLDDEETIANRLEELLEASRGPGVQPVICRTVAVGRWNHRNAVQFVLDHIADLQPDIVLYIPFANDLSDSDIVAETGNREPFPDPASPDPWLSVRADVNRRLWDRVASALDAGTISLRRKDIGPDALTSDLSPESSRRYDENAASIARLSGAVAARGGRLLLLPYLEHDHSRHLLARLARTLPDLPVTPLFRRVPPEFSLGFDPHPNAATARVMAIWIAQALFDRGLLDRGDGVPLPDVPPEYSRERAATLDAAQVASFSSQARAEARARLLPEIDFRIGRGVLQIYGGVSVNGIVASRALLLLAPATGAADARAGARPAGEHLEVELAPIPGRPDLYPLDVAVFVDGARVGGVTLTAGGPAQARLPLPPRADPMAPLEVKLVAPRWIVASFGPTLEAASFGPVRVACASGTD